MKFFAWIAAALAMAAAASDELPTRLDVASDPAGAKVMVDGKFCGTTPCQIFDVAPGRRLVRLERDSFRPALEFVEIAKGQFVQRAYNLAEEKALILVKTDPAGAEVRYSGVTLGTTPLLVTSLASGVNHTLELSLNGYRPRRIDVRAEGRHPVVREENLSLDSGTVVCNSSPAGAAVIVNGVERGRTPLEVSGIPKGLASVTFRLPGYTEETRELRVSAGDRQTLSINLKGVPGSLKVVSSPENARVFVDGNYQGKTPLAVKSLAAGEHEVRVELEGYASVSRTVAIRNGAEHTADFTLESTLARLEVVTIPAGARISVDGRNLGTTAADGASARSKTLMLGNIPVGERSIVIHAEGFQDEMRKIEFRPQETRQLTVRLMRVFTPDTEVETISGSAPVRGVLVSNDAAGLTLEVRPGVMRTIPHNEIRKKYSLKK